MSVEPRHVGFTGTRHGMTIGQAATVAGLIADYDWLHHGDCIGADAEAHAVAIEAGLKIEIHPPTNPALRANCTAHRCNEPKDYITRDRDIVHAVAHLIAAPRGMSEELRSGTWTTIRYSRRIGRSVSIVFPDGSVRHEPDPSAAYRLETVDE